MDLNLQIQQAGASESWWQAVQAELERGQYAATPIQGGLQAPNDAHNLRTTFGAGGIEVLPKVAREAAPAWRFAWQTTGIGRPGRIEEVPPSSPSAAGARVVYERDGWSEWYENRKEGLEQGFTVSQRPAGAGPFRITGTIPDGLRPEMREDGAVDFIDEDGACVIRYGELHVWDATGQELPAELVLAANTLAIQVDDHNAVYPLMIDPLMTSPAWTAEGNQTGASFGYSVGTAGDVNGDGYSDIIVGAPQYDNGAEDEGRAYVYHGSAAGLATTPAWTAEGNAEYGWFGTSVATAGDVNGDGFADVIVGAQFIPNGPNFQGAFVYYGSATGLAASPQWIAETAQGDAGFGSSVGTAGDVNGDGFDEVIVGASLFDNGQMDEGRAFVYHGSAGGLAASPTWTGESNQVGAAYGYSVFTAGDVNADGFDDVIVGATGFDNNNQPNQGRAFVYHGSASGLATTAAWTGEGGVQGSGYGSSVGTAGDLNGDGYADIIVGCPRFNNPEAWEGRAFVYHGSAVGLGTTPAWTAESNQIGAEWGNAVATAGDVNGDGYSDVIIGAYMYDNGQPNEGLALMYLGSATGLGPTAAWTAENDQGSFAYAVSSAGDVNGDGYSDVIVGANNYFNGQFSEGRAYVYHGVPAGLTTTPAWTDEGSQANALYGSSVATAGDVNGDGYSDIIVYASGSENGQPNVGRAFVYNGSASGPATVPSWTWGSNQANATQSLIRTGAATAGDVNGDGFSDVIVGFPNYDNDQVNEGRVVVFHGSETGLASSPAWTVESNQVDSGFGFSVATAGDVNGDGFSDVIVGAHKYDDVHTNDGRAYAYYGSVGGLASTPGWIAGVQQGGAQFGSVVATAGDVNADGFSDVLVGAELYDALGHLDAGAVVVYLGSPNGLSATMDPAWMVMGESVFVQAGYSAGTAGDVDGDGFSDVITGVIGFEEGRGGALIHRGSLSGLVPFDMVLGLGDDSFGQSVGTAGDLNSDGFSDILVSENVGVGGGWAYIFYGSPIGYYDYDTISVLAHCRVATAGDVNGDGFPDPVYGEPLPSIGVARVHLGNEGDGLDRIARQVRTDDSAPIWPLGNSDSESAFRLNVTARTAAGRGDVRVQCEVKPAGVPFDGTGLVTGPMTNTGAPSASGSAVPLSQLVSGLVPATLYHWRLRVISDSPFFPRSPWLWQPYNAVSEADVRTGEETTGVAEGPASPVPGIRLASPTPNPFASAARFDYTLAGEGRHRLSIYDVHGREVAVVADGVQSAGRHSMQWDGRDARGAQLASGVYFLRLEMGGHVEAQKLVIAR